MKKRIKKTIRNNIIHPAHWHVSMFVAIAAILLTSFKSSAEMVRALHAVPAHETVLDSLHLREAETTHAALMLGAGLRNATLSSGK